MDPQGITVSAMTKASLTCKNPWKACQTPQNTVEIPQPQLQKSRKPQLMQKA